MTKIEEKRAAIAEWFVMLALATAITLTILIGVAVMSSINYGDKIEVIEVQDMTCIVYKKYKDSIGGGITCNWSEWDGGLDE